MLMWCEGGWTNLSDDMYRLALKAGARPEVIVSYGNPDFPENEPLQLDLMNKF